MADIRKRVAEKTAQAITITPNVSTLGKTINAYAVSRGETANGTVSGSIQVDHDATTNFVSGEHFTQANITTVGTVTAGSVAAILPADILSGSINNNNWSGVDLSVVNGGTGLSSVTSNAILKGNATGALVVSGVTIDASNQITAADFILSSDIKLKRNVEPLNNSLIHIQRLNGIRYNLKGEPNSRKRLGVIAQDVEAVYPEAVILKEDGFKGVSYNQLVPVLLEAIKELNVRVEYLEGKLDAR